MDQLEKLILSQKDKIQNDQLHEGHAERFALKLNRFQHRRKKRMFAYISSIAAVLLIAIFISVRPQFEAQTLKLSDVSQHYSDVEFYYTSSIKRQTKKLELLSKQIESNQVLKLMIEEAEKYDKIYDQLCHDLEATPNDQRVINALIVYYQTKLEVINKILTEIENKQITKDENISI
jgi:hypothetical protein